MRNLLWSLLLGLLTIACSGDDKKSGADVSNTDTVDIVTPINIMDFIEGEWVADYAIDDPKGYRWEILKLG